MSLAATLARAGAHAQTRTHALARGRQTWREQFASATARPGRARILVLDPQFKCLALVRPLAYSSEWPSALAGWLADSPSEVKWEGGTEAKRPNAAEVK